MSTRSPYPVFDADNHMYETKDAFTKFLPKEFEGAIRYVEIDGRTKIAIRGQISEYIPNPTFDVVARPGAQEDYFRIGNPEGKSYREIIGKPMRAIPAFREPESRLALMDEQGLDRTLMFPTLASLLEERMRDRLAGFVRLQVALRDVRHVRRAVHEDVVPGPISRGTRARHLFVPLVARLAGRIHVDDDAAIVEGFPGLHLAKRRIAVVLHC